MGQRESMDVRRLRWRGVILAVLAVFGAFGISVTQRADAQQALARPVSVTTGNTGRPTDGAFSIDFSQGFVRDTQVLADWDIRQDWLNVSYRKANIGFDGGLMTLKSIRGGSASARYTSAEFQRGGFYGFGRYEAVMRAASGKGVVSAFFSYAGEDVGDPHDEIDFEVLGRSPRQAHTNVFSHGESVPADVDLWFDASAAEHLYAFEWTIDGIAWFIDGVKVREVRSSDAGVRIPTTAARVMTSIWAAQGQVAEWVGEPEFATTQATFRCISHVPLGQSGLQCSDTFKPPAR